MAQSVITRAFLRLKAQQSMSGAPVILDEFIFANVPGLDTGAGISPDETIPPDEQIVYRKAVEKSGVVNENAVVYSVTLGAEVGDFDFNWVGLISRSTSTLAMVVHAPAQKKIRNNRGQQGNVLVRSMLMEYSGAKETTGITTPAQTWQIDFTARLGGMDERQRLENIDIYGPAGFAGDGWQVVKSGTRYTVKRGLGYVAGLRAELSENQTLTGVEAPTRVWLDVSWQGSLTSVWVVHHKITVARSLADYTESGFQHYVFALADIDASGTVTDLRPRETLIDRRHEDAIRTHERSRNHPDATLTAKGFTQLSSATDSDDETRAATPKAVKAAYDLAKGKAPATHNHPWGQITGVPAATTSRTGIVQLSSATDSDDETRAATPKAVKDALRLASQSAGPEIQDATTTRKGIVQLSSATSSTSESLAATPKAVKDVHDEILRTVVKDIRPGAARTVTVNTGETGASLGGPSLISRMVARNTVSDLVVPGGGGRPGDPYGGGTATPSSGGVQFELTCHSVQKLINNQWLNVE